MAVGDTFVIRTLDEVLTYAVTQILIVEPADTQSLTIQEGLAYAAQEDLWVAAICAAPSVLGENGLLHGRKYTCYPGFENDEKYHGTYTAAPLQQDGKIITANGAGNAMTFALYLLAALQGEEKALEVGRSIQIKL